MKGIIGHRLEADRLLKAKNLLDEIEENRLTKELLRQMEEARRCDEMIKNLPHIPAYAPVPPTPELPKFEFRNFAQETIDYIYQRLSEEEGRLKDGESITFYIIVGNEKMKVLETTAINNFQIEVKGLLDGADACFIVRFDEIKALLQKSGDPPDLVEFVS